MEVMEYGLYFTMIVAGSMALGAMAMGFAGLYKLMWSIFSTTEEESTIEAKKLNELLGK